MSVFDCDKFTDLGCSQEIIIPRDYEHSGHLDNFLKDYDKWLISINYRSIYYRPEPPQRLMAGERYLAVFWKVAQSSCSVEDVMALFGKHKVALAGLRAVTVFCQLQFKSQEFIIPSNKWLLTFDDFKKVNQLALVRREGCRYFNLWSINTQATNLEQTRPLWNDVCYIFGLIPC